MHDAGVNIVINSDSADEGRYLYLNAAKVLKYNDHPDELDALKMITINAAKTLEMESRIGSIEVGKDGDIAVFDKHPLDSTTKCLMTIIEGEVFFDYAKETKADSAAQTPGMGSSVATPPEAPPLELRGYVMNRKGARLIALLSAAAFSAAPFAARAQDSLLIKGGTIIPVTGKPIPNGSLLIMNGKIAKLGTGLSAPAGATVIEAKGMYVYPGMVAPLTAIGLTGYPGAGNDTNEVGQSTPQIDAYEGLNPEDETIEVTRIDGVTTVMTAAGSSAMINGRAVALNLDGDLPKDMLIKRDVCLVFNVGARSESGPNTLMGVTAFIRDKLNQGQGFRRQEGLRRRRALLRRQPRRRSAGQARPGA